MAANALLTLAKQMRKDQCERELANRRFAGHDVCREVLFSIRSQKKRFNLCTTCLQESGFEGPEIGPKQRRINNRLVSYRPTK